MTDPQQTPQPSDDAAPHVYAIMVRRIELQSRQLESLESHILRATENLSALTRRITTVVDEQQRLGNEVRQLMARYDSIQDQLGGIREGVRRTNQRLRSGVAE